MNIIIHLVILFVYVFALLMLNLPGFDTDNFLKQKLYIFVGIFLFELLVATFVTIYRKCIVDLGKIARRSFISALLATVAYSVYNDLVWNSNPLVAGQKSEISKNLMITTIIILFISAGYFLELLFSGFNPKMNDCLNHIYQNEKIQDKNTKKN